MSKLLSRSLVVILVVGVSFFVLAPNLLVQRLQIVFHDYKRLPDGKKVSISEAEIQDFILDRENGLGLHFPGTRCLPEAKEKIPATRRCVLEDHFITAARINAMAQAHGDLIDELHTVVLPHPIEKFFSFLTESDHKNLKVKLGLDLQGGMRATFRADFDTYLARMREKYEPVLKDLKQKLAQEKSVEEQKNLGYRIQEIETILTLNEARRQDLLEEAKRVIDKRLASQSLTEPEVRVQPASYSIGVDMPGMANSSEVLSKIKDTVTVEYRIVNEEATERINTAEAQQDLERIQNMYRDGNVDSVEIKEILANLSAKAGLKPEDGRVFLYWRKGRTEQSAYLPRELRVLGPAVLDGSDMTHAQENPGESAWYRIDFGLSGLGAEKFADITTKNVGKRLAILWGDRVVSDPRIQGPIVGGNGVITGQFGKTEAAEISNVIREGAMPLPLEILSVSFVGPSLGQESIVAGMLSILLGFLVVIFFMIGYYKLTGMVAIVALFLNVIIMSAVLSFLEFTLTLPGFAGIILTIGMAVDANVIIFEKIKEDLRHGKSPSLALDAGFQSSFWTILDSNVTSLIAALVLYYTKDGPIMGFAITLFWGLVTSMFTALYVSRLQFDLAMRFGVRRLSIGYGFSKAGVKA